MSDATSVILFNESAPVPVFHLYRSWTPNGAGYFEPQRTRTELPSGRVEVVNRTLTVCGLTIAEWSWFERDGVTLSLAGRDRRRGILLRRDHAEAFARLCVRCKAGAA